MDFLIQAVFLTSPIFILVSACLYFKLMKVWHRCKIAHYCWQSMSDFAGEITRQDQFLYEKWQIVAKEQIALLKEYDLNVVDERNVLKFESELLQAQRPILTQHKLI